MQTPWKLQYGPRRPTNALPQKGVIYTISGKEFYKGAQWLTLTAFPENQKFLAKMFRPIVKRKTDISIFTKMLKELETINA